MLRNFKLPLPLFSPESAWKQRADEVPLDPECVARLETMLALLIEFEEKTGNRINTFYVNLQEFSIPVFACRRPTLRMKSYTGEEWPTHDPVALHERGGWIVPGLPIPEGPVRPAGPEGTESDGHLVLYDADSHTEYDFFQATTRCGDDSRSLGGGIIGNEVFEAGFVARFSLDGLGAQVAEDDHRPLNSARASGVALLAGLMLPEDINSIIPEDLSDRSVRAHAPAFALPRLRCLAFDCSDTIASDFVYPASKSETRFHTRDPLAWAAGERIRLGSRQCVDGETAWAAVINTLNEQLSWQLASLHGLASQPLPFILPAGTGFVGNVEVIAPAQPPMDW